MQLKRATFFLLVSTASIALATRVKGNKVSIYSPSLRSLQADSNSPSQSPYEPSTECMICLEKIDDESTFYDEAVYACTHYKHMHEKCMKKYIEGKISAEKNYLPFMPDTYDGIE